MAVFGGQRKRLEICPLGWKGTLGLHRKGEQGKGWEFCRVGNPGQVVVWLIGVSGQLLGSWEGHLQEKTAGFPWRDGGSGSGAASVPTWGWSCHGAAGEVPLFLESEVAAKTMT